MTYQPGMAVSEQGSIAASPTFKSGDRRRRPVFVMGCHRSGTNLLYDTLLSAGGFAVYRGYLPVYKILIPRFGKLADPSNREKILNAWVRSKGFRRSGLNGDEITAKLMVEARTGGDFIRIVMEEIASQQKADRWCVYDPDNVLHVPKIKREIPDALFIHIIRDGRDIAVSLAKMGGFRPLPWGHADTSLAGSALYWEWMVRSGRRHGRSIPDDYIEIRYEDLVQHPRLVLQNLSDFLGHDLDYDRIQQAGLGRLRESNSSFLDESADVSANPVQRWKQRLGPQQVAEVESLIGECLEDFGYRLETSAAERRQGFRRKCVRHAYLNLLRSKFWVRYHTPLRRLASLAALELTESEAERAQEEP